MNFPSEGLAKARTEGAGMGGGVLERVRRNCNVTNTKVDGGL